MKKLFKTIFLSLLTLTVVFGAVACKNNEAEKKVGIKCKGSNNEYTLTAYYAEDGVTSLDLDAAVKAKYGKDAVLTRIVTGAFSGNDTIKKITVPSTVKKIDGGAFKGMSKLEEISLPFVGMTLNADAYLGQTSNATDKAVNEEKNFGYIFGTEEYAGGSKITMYSEAGSKDYYVPMTLKTIEINPSEDYEIPAYAFAGLTKISSITFNDKVVGIGSYAFNECNCVNSLDLSKKVANIYANAFECFDSLKTIEIRNANVKLGNYAFKNCSNLEKISFHGFDSDWANVIKDAVGWNDGANEDCKVEVSEPQPA